MPRTEERIGVRREIVLESASGRRETRISDLSMGGCYIESISSFPSGEEVFFDLENPGGQVLRFSGRVAYMLEGFGFGVTFTDLSPAHLDFLRTAVVPSPPEPDILQQ